MASKSHLYVTALDNIGGTRSLTTKKTSNLSLFGKKHAKLNKFQSLSFPKVFYNQKIKRIINSSDKLLLNSFRLANRKFSLLFHKINFANTFFS